MKITDSQEEFEIKIIFQLVFYRVWLFEFGLTS